MGVWISPWVIFIVPSSIMPEQKVKEKFKILKINRYGAKGLGLFSFLSPPPPLVTLFWFFDVSTLISLIKIVTPQFTSELVDFFFILSEFLDRRRPGLNGPKPHNKLQRNDVLCLVSFMSAISAVLVSQKSTLPVDIIGLSSCSALFHDGIAVGEKMLHSLSCELVFFHPSTLTYADIQRLFAYILAEYMIYLIPVLPKCINSPEEKKH